MRAADLVLHSPTGRRLALWAGLGAVALALTSLAAFSKDHALMINASPSLPYWAIWLDRGALPQRGEIGGFMKRTFGHGAFTKKTERQSIFTQLLCSERQTCRLRYAASDNGIATKEAMLAREQMH